MNDHPAPGRRGSLPGLALVVGLLAFLIVDGRTPDGPGGSPPSPGGESSAGSLTAFGVASTVVIALFVLLISWYVVRRRRTRSVSAEPSPDDRDRRTVATVALPDSDFQTLVTASRRTLRRRPMPNREFVQAVDDLLVETDWQRPEEVERFVAVLRGATEEQLNYLATMVKYRRLPR